jgi:branched-chain amino acid transport system ATP-binding protein
VSVKIAARSLNSGYHGIAAIHDIDLEVSAGEMVLLGGSNGAGKSTTLMTLAGAIAPMSGAVEHEGEATTAAMHHRVRAGVGVITEQRTVFMSLTVAENLRLGRGSTETALEYFPELEKRMKVKAGLCSGGEQQMLSVGRVLASNPSTILADELSLGLAPIIVQRLLAALRSAADRGSAVLIVEQHVRAAMPFIDRGYFLRRGRIALTGTQEELRNSEEQIRETYL